MEAIPESTGKFQPHKVDLGTAPGFTLAMMTLRIGKIAAAVGISPDSLRYYERLGLLPGVARSNGGYREYPEEMTHRVRFIRNALRFGFSLKEVATFLRASESGYMPCKQVREAGQQILARVDRQIKDLSAARRAIRQTLTDWDARLASTPDGQPARLLRMLKEDQIPTDCVSVRLKRTRPGRTEK